MDDRQVDLAGRHRVDELARFAVAREGQAHDFDALALGKQVGGDDRRLRRGTGDHDRVSSSTDESLRVRRMPFSDGTKVTGIAIGRDCGWAESYVDHK